MLSKAVLLKSWEDIRSSYWFIPSVMALGAILLSVAAVWVDSAVGADWLADVPWLYANRPAGARDLLSTIAGSMITVAGVTFSITVAAVAYAASQFGPRLLTNFMDDRGNQVTLGVFIATFLYCLLVLRTIRDGEELPAAAAADVTASAAEGAFVPHSAILVALALAVLCVGVLIYFIHHVPQSIHVSNVISAVGRDLIDGIGRLFPAVGDAAGGIPAAGRPADAGFGEAADDSPAAAAPSGAGPAGYAGDPTPPDAVPVGARGPGYVQHQDKDGATRIARDRDIVVRLLARPGDFAREGQPLAYAWPGDRVTDEVVEDLRETFALGSRRTHAQDVVFLVNELAEIAARALSPGVNDPFTASSCIDWLGAAGTELAARPTRDAVRRDDSGAPRLIARTLQFGEFLDEGFGRVRPYAARDINACTHQLETLAAVAAQLEHGDDRAAILKEARALAAEAEGQLAGPEDMARVRERLEGIERLVAGRVSVAGLAWERRWFMGRA